MAVSVIVHGANVTEVGGGNTASKRDIREAAKVIRARKELNDLAEMRLIHWARRAKTTQDDMAALLGTSQPTISRITAHIQKTPSVLKRGPLEIINQRVVGEIDTSVMMDALISCSYGQVGYDPTGGDGFIRGDWRQMENALTSGLITDEEYERVARAASVAGHERAAF